MRFVLGIFVAAAFVGALWGGWTFRASNSLAIDLDLIWFRVPNVELWWVLLLTMGVGAVLASLVVGFAWLRARLVNRRYRGIIKKLEKEVHQLRSLPLVGSEPGGSNLDLVPTQVDEPDAVSDTNPDGGVAAAGERS